MEFRRVLFRSASHRAILLARIHAKMLKHVNRYFVRIEWQGQLKISHLESPYRWVQKDSTTSLLCGNSFSGVEMTKSEEHTSELQSLMRISYAVFCLKIKNIKQKKHKKS